MLKDECTETLYKSPMTRIPGQALNFISRSKAAKRLAYRSVDGFMRFVKRTSDFPRPIRLSPSRTVFVEQDIDEWINAQPGI